jgi:hypothetical protein
MPSCAAVVQREAFARAVVYEPIEQCMQNGEIDNLEETRRRRRIVSLDRIAREIGNGKRARVLNMSSE